MKEIFPIRLKNARIMKGLSLDELCEAMENKVSKNALSKYEKGKIFPSSSVLISLSKVLGVPLDDFFRPITVSIDVNSIKYRKRSTLSKKSINAINEYVSSELEKYIEVEQLSNETKDFSVNFHDVEVKTDTDAIALAVRFREEFHLGEAPIINPIEMLESSGAKIIEVDAPNKFDGDSFTVNNIFVIVLNRQFTPERKRLSLFHEVGHRVMRFANDVDEEKMCNIFANEVLMPSKVFLNKIGKQRKDIALVEMKDLQTQFGISIEALMIKAEQLNVISQNRYTTFCIKKNKNIEFKNNVLESVFPDESCTRYKRLVYRLLANELITESKGAAYLNCSVADIHANLNLM